MKDIKSLLIKVDKIEHLAQSGRLTRFIYRPLHYVFAVVFIRLVYHLFKKGKQVITYTFFGEPMKVVLPAATDIYLFGGKTHDSEIRLTRFLIKHIKEGSVIADVGAHFGFFSLLGSYLAGAPGKIFSFEPSPFTFRILEENTHFAQNIEPFQVAVGNDNKPVIFYQFPLLYSEYNSSHLPAGKSEKWLQCNEPEKLEISSRSLDSFFDERNIHPDFIKIDVEGAEMSVFHGMKNMMNRHAPIIAMEYHRNSEIHRKVVEYADSIGYAANQIDHTGYLKHVKNLDESIASQGLDSDNIVFRKRPVP